MASASLMLPGTGIADEEVGKAHIKGNVGGEFLDVHRHAMAHRGQFALGFLVASAENDHLDFGHQGGGQIRAEPKAGALGGVAASPL